MPARYDYGGGTYPRPDIDKDGFGFAACPYCWGEVKTDPEAHVEVEVQDWEGVCPRCKRDVTFD